MRVFLSPDGDDDDDVAAADEEGGDDEERDGDEGHVEAPLPLLVKVDPALRAVALDLAGLVEVEDGRREEEGERPRGHHQALRATPRA